METNDTLAVPRINLSGTDGDALQKECADAYVAISNAVTAVQAMTVHGRDFQIGADGPEMFQHYRNQHIDRLKRLVTVADEVMAVYNELSSQMVGKR